MEIAFYVDEYPFPARSGTTIPTANYIEGLSRLGYAITLFLLQDEAAPEEPAAALLGREFLRDIVVVRRRRRPKARAMLGELLGREPVFHAWTYPAGPAGARDGLTGFDAVIASPISALDAPLRVEGAPPVLAAISDCYTSVLRSARLASFAPRELAHFGMQRWRGIYMGGLERRALASCTAVVVQTDVDQAWLATACGADVAAKSTAISNGVDEGLLAIAPTGTDPVPRAVYLANFRAKHYRDSLRWFHEKVWRAIAPGLPQARLLVVGKGLEADPALLAALRADPSVEVRGFIDDLAEVYMISRVSVAPIFKRYGFINKTAESLAAGVPVVGDTSAFSGLDLPAAAGFAVRGDDVAAFRAGCERFLTMGPEWAALSAQAKAFGKSLRWECKIQVLDRVLKEGAR